MVSFVLEWHNPVEVNEKGWASTGTYLFHDWICLHAVGSRLKMRVTDKRCQYWRDIRLQVGQGSKH